MKSFIKIFGIVALVAAIGFSVVGCESEEEEDDDGELTITGLGDYNGKYAIAIGGNEKEDGLRLWAAASIDMEKQIITGSKISGGSVTLKVWKRESGDKLSSYSGNDTVLMSVAILNKALFDDESESEIVADGIVTVTFKNGVASGVFDYWDED